MKWFTRHRAKGWATCPFTQAGFVRSVSNPAFSRDAVQPREAIHVLSSNTAAKDHAFWPDQLPVAEAVAFTRVRLMGHQQVTDAYLLGLAIRRGGVLASWINASRRLRNPSRPSERRWRRWGDHRRNTAPRFSAGFSSARANKASSRFGFIGSDSLAWHVGRD